MERTAALVLTGGFQYGKWPRGVRQRSAVAGCLLGIWWDLEQGGVGDSGR